MDHCQLFNSNSSDSRQFFPLAFYNAPKQIDRRHPRALPPWFLFLHFFPTLKNRPRAHPVHGVRPGFPGEGLREHLLPGFGQQPVEVFLVPV